MKVARHLLLALALGCIGFLALAGYFDRSFVSEVSATGTPKAAHRRIAAVYFSGDVGYRVGMGRTLGNRLSAAGIPVIAVNSLGFFRQHRSVPEVTALIARTIRQALIFGHADQVVLIGHSLGADAMQAALVDLPPNLRAKVRCVILLVPTTRLYLQISPAEMLDLGQPDAAVLPTIKTLTWSPLTCIYGRDESDSPCRQLDAPNARSIALPGGHAMDWDTESIFSAMLRSIDAAAPGEITKS